jgi:hypothetical protein
MVCGLLKGARMRKTILLTFLAGCGAPIEGSDATNPFLQDQSNDGKADTAYLNPDGIESEVDIEGDVTGPTYRLPDGPAVLGQFALTYLRKRGDVYLESLAEDSTADDRAEWQVNGTWYASNNLPAGATLKHWRMRAINAVLLFSAAKGATVGKTFDVKAPVKPFSIMSDADNACADEDADIPLDQDVYWYLWNPSKSGCKASLQQSLTVTISKLQKSSTTTVYPEFDKLTADKKITTVILFGQIGHGALTDDDTGMVGLRTMVGWLKGAKFKEVTAPVGRRFEKLINGITMQIDLYSPHEFAGLDDFDHFDNFQKALSEHEIIAYDGHSMLGASDFWAKPTYPSFYQIFLYGGCLGYEYYVRPILNGKGGTWTNLDVMSSVVEVSAGANEFAGPFLAKLVWALDHGNHASWREMLVAVRRSVGDSTFGVSGVRGNKYHP